MHPTKLLAALLALGLVLAACGDDTNKADQADKADQATVTTTAGSSSTAADPYGPGGTTATSAAATGAATVAVAHDPKLGDHLVGPDGRTLYLFEKDQGTTTACTGACADSWPPLVASGAVKAGEGVEADELATADGIEPDQVTYHGHLLYYFAGDHAPGDANGTSVPSWYAVDASGEPIGDD